MVRQQRISQHQWYTHSITYAIITSHSDIFTTNYHPLINNSQQQLCMYNFGHYQYPLATMSKHSYQLQIQIKDSEMSETANFSW